MTVGKTRVKIGVLKKATEGALKDINQLMLQLRRKGSKTTGTKAELKAILANKHVVMVVAEDGKKIVGVATLYIFQKIGKRAAHVEDVVVDGAYRGQGLGKKLMNALIAAARARGVERLELTSGADRVAANALYVKLGFTLRKTNAYALSL